MPAISLLPVDPSTRRTQPGPSEYAVTSVYVDSAQQRDWNRGRRSHREPGRQHLADIQRLPANLERGVDAALSAPSPDGRSSPTLNATPLRIEVQSRDRRSSGSVKGRKSPRSPGSPGPVKGAAASARRHLGLESPEVRGVLALPDVRSEREPGLGRLLLDGELLGTAGGSRERRGAYTYVTAFEYDMLEDKMQEVVQERDAAVEEIGRLNAHYHAALRDQKRNFETAEDSFSSQHLNDKQKVLDLSLALSRAVDDKKAMLLRCHEGHAAVRSKALSLLQRARRRTVQRVVFTAMLANRQLTKHNTLVYKGLENITARWRKAHGSRSFSCWRRVSAQARLDRVRVHAGWSIAAVRARDVRRRALAAWAALAQTQAKASADVARAANHRLGRCFLLEWRSCLTLRRRARLRLQRALLGLKGYTQWQRLKRRAHWRVAVVSRRRLGALARECAGEWRRATQAAAHDRRLCALVKERLVHLAHGVCRALIAWRRHLAQVSRLRRLVGLWSGDCLQRSFVRWQSMCREGRRGSQLLRLFLRTPSTAARANALAMQRHLRAWAALGRLQAWEAAAARALRRVHQLRRRGKLFLRLALAACVEGHARRLHDSNLEKAALLCRIVTISMRARAWRAWQCQLALSQHLTVTAARVGIRWGQSSREARLRQHLFAWHHQAQESRERARHRVDEHAALVTASFRLWKELSARISRLRSTLGTGAGTATPGRDRQVAQARVSPQAAHISSTRRRGYLAESEREGLQRHEEAYWARRTLGGGGGRGEEEDGGDVDQSVIKGAHLSFSPSPPNTAAKQLHALLSEAGSFVEASRHFDDEAATASEEPAAPAASPALYPARAGISITDCNRDTIARNLRNLDLTAGRALAAASPKWQMHGRGCRTASPSAGAQRGASQIGGDGGSASPLPVFPSPHTHRHTLPRPPSHSPLRLTPSAPPRSDQTSGPGSGRRRFLERTGGKTKEGKRGADRADEDSLVMRYLKEREKEFKGKRQEQELLNRYRSFLPSRAEVGGTKGKMMASRALKRSKEEQETSMQSKAAYSAVLAVSGAVMSRINAKGTKKL